MATNPTSTNDPLATLNSKTLGASFPVITLPDGRKVQTGTVGALLVNIKSYDALVASTDLATAEKQAKVAELEESFKAAIPLVQNVGLFNLFEPAEWVAGERSAGRRRVGELALEAQRQTEQGGE